METFPFTDAEWEPVEEAALALVNAGMADDDALQASLRLEILALLSALRDRHGDHPFLLELVADYTEGDDAARAELYRRALGIALSNELPTLSIRLALARLLVAVGEPVSALEELRACGDIAAAGNSRARSDWAEVLESVARETECDADRGPLYRRAMEIAAAHGVPALNIRLSFVRFLLDNGEPVSALEELRACRSEIPGASEDERTWWAGLLAEAMRAEPDAAPDSGS